MSAEEENREKNIDKAELKAAQVQPKHKAGRELPASGGYRAHHIRSCSEAGPASQFEHAKPESILAFHMIAMLEGPAVLCSRRASKTVFHHLSRENKILCRDTVQDPFPSNASTRYAGRNVGPYG
jgi:hypothetical protein